MNGFGPGTLTVTGVTFGFVNRIAGVRRSLIGPVLTRRLRWGLRRKLLRSKGRKLKSDMNGKTRPDPFADNRGRNFRAGDILGLQWIDMNKSKVRRATT